MLPRLQRSMFQRTIRLSKFAVALQEINPLPTTYKCDHVYFRNSEQFLSSRYVHTQCACKVTKGSNLRLNGATVQTINQCRYKSSKLQQEKKDIDAAKEDEEKEVTSEEVVPADSARVLKPKQRSSTSGDLIPKSVEEDEKSRRRYEKQDPPEEERHKEQKKMPERSINKALMRTDYFDNMKSKNKETFAFAIELFTERDVHLRGHVEFIYAALKEMKRFGVHRDLDAYKKIIDIFPKGRMIQTNMFQVEFLHFPKQQQCAIDVLEQMEDNAVIPDSETQQMLTNIFGSWSFPMRKASRMLYWMPKFKYLSPWPLPDKMPDNALELAKLAVQRMTSVDLTTKISIYDCAELEDAYDLTWIVSGQSPEQQKLIENHPSDRPIYVEGAFRVWLKNYCMNYFILRAEPRPTPVDNTDTDDVGNIPTVFEEEFVDQALQPVPTVHEQEDGVILGVCCTGSSSRDSVVSWIRFLEQTNPRLGKDVSVLFTLKSPIGPTDDLEILSYRDIEELKKLGKAKDPFLSPNNNLGFDSGMPDLRQVGVWTDSDSSFPNWPHHFHKPDSASYKNKMENERLIQELERKEMSKPRKIGEDDKVSESVSDDKKQIE